jgi:hypothetical protein
LYRGNTFSPRRLTNRLIAATQPVNRCTSLRQVGCLMLRMALIFSGSTSMPPCETMKPRSFPSGTPKTDFSGFTSMPLVSSKVIKGLLKVADQVGSFPGHDLDVIDVSVHVPANLVLQASLHRTLIGGTCVFQTKSHGDIAVSAKRGDKGGHRLVRLLHPDLMIPGICVEKTQKFRPSR